MTSAMMRCVCLRAASSRRLFRATARERGEGGCVLVCVHVCVRVLVRTERGRESVCLVRENRNGD
jgi:hypothetical protein